MPNDAYVSIAFNEYRGTILSDTYGVVIGYNSNEEPLEAIRLKAGIKEHGTNQLLYDGSDFREARRSIAHLRTFEQFLNEHKLQFLDDLIPTGINGFLSPKFNQN